MHTHILMIHCRDESGLVYKITSVLYRHQLNIISNDEFVERDSNWFFMRTEVSGEVNRAILLQDLYALLPDGVEVKLTDNRKKKIVVLATKEYHCLSDLLVRHHYHDLNATILAVISNYDHLKDLTQKLAVPYYFIDHSNKSREQHEEEILLLLQQFDLEFIVLAKYMRILSPQFVAHYSNKIINIHHSFLPAFIGAHPYQQAYNRGVKIIGATAHFVNENLDEGPIISQNVIHVDHSHNAKELAQTGRDIEKSVLARALKLVLNERVFVHHNKTIIFE
ncbi:MAG: formyltetrahydrofolate deformylase [Bacteroidota bacterium]|nr:formyltetrahydrofolate deformylase [Flavisolibacter sp.]MDQ3844621.1 formyltetrahydrofolate deformylase [Bacteroidota bacterium]MBD0289156.1 formyltetrahydrofolate deformylase [Flavisolibacter sp.]MBD0295636.1 formyltetrahydrofolate deformylase [Flavisolibacter sp.]MBD0365196.1 formyltetrahydrofolate deformylase [Flavisolibacter sp.]